MDDELAIKLDGVTKCYKLYDSPRDRVKEALIPFGKIYHKDFYALNRIDLEIKKGEILGVVGKNGCGKSTLLKLISGVLTANEGNVQVDGRISALLELGSGFNPEFTGLKNIFFYGTILGFSKVEMDEKLKEIQEFADLGDFIHQPLKTYSSGMKARLGFAMSVSVNPDILIIDEVLSVGDLMFRRKCYNKINELFNDGKTVILVSHNSQVITQHCNRAILLHGGAIVKDGKPKDVLNYYENEVISVPEATTGISGNEHEPEALGNEIVDSMQSNQHLAKLFDVKVLGPDNKVVNRLDRYVSYDVEFKVKFHQSLEQISVGARIKDLKGFVISGANIYDYQQQLISHVNKDDVIKVNWKFKCLLVPGEYSVSVFSFSSNENVVIELNEAALLKVAPNDRVNYGVVDLEQEISFERISSSESLKVESQTR